MLILKMLGAFSMGVATAAMLRIFVFSETDMGLLACILAGICVQTILGFLVVYLEEK